MPKINNENDLRKLIQEKTEKVLEKVTDKILDRLKKQIQKDVFTESNDWYVRTGEFEDAWKWDDITKTVSSIVKKLSYDPSNMRYDPAQWIHGNPSQSAVDSLADILNLAHNNYQPGYTSSLKFGDRYFSHYRRPYWENFLNDLFDRGELEKLLSEEFSKEGFSKK